MPLWKATKVSPVAASVLLSNSASMEPGGAIVNSVVARCSVRIATVLVGGGDLPFLSTQGDLETSTVSDGSGVSPTKMTQPAAGVICVPEFDVPEILTVAPATGSSPLFLTVTSKPVTNVLAMLDWLTGGREPRAGQVAEEVVWI